MQSGRWLCIGPQVARLRPSSRPDILLETRPLIFSFWIFFSGPPRAVAQASEGNQAGGRRPLPSAAPPSPASPKKSEGRQNRQNASVLWVLQNRPKQNRTGGWGLVLSFLAGLWLALRPRGRAGGPVVKTGACPGLRYFPRRFFLVRCGRPAPHRRQAPFSQPKSSAELGSASGSGNRLIIAPCQAPWRTNGSSGCSGRSG